MEDFNVVLVEDAGIVANDIDQTITEAGFRMVDKFSSGEQALEQLDEADPDLVLMDIQLSGELDGIETTEKIEESYSVPVIFLTAYSNPDTIERARETGAVAYLVKPLDKDDLDSIIHWIQSGKEGASPKIERGEMLQE
jgi:DNA-binding NarL/FixJ family response regulator